MAKRLLFLLILFLTMGLLPASASSDVVFSPARLDVSVKTVERCNFSVSAPLPSDIVWSLDGVIVQQDNSCLSSEYLFTKNDAGYYVLTVTIDDGTSVQNNEWYLEVLPNFDVTFSPGEAVITSRLDRKLEFTTNMSETSNVFWYLDGELIRAFNGVNDSIYVPELSDTGNYSIKVLVTNDNGTVWNQWHWVATSTPAQIMSGGSGSGGSSVSVSSGEDYGNILLKDVRMQVVNKGAITTYSFPDSLDPIDSVEFISSVNAGYVKTIVEVLKDRSPSVSKNPGDTVYCYVNIILGSNGLESKLSDKRIVFHVSREWIDENNIDIDSIRLNVFGDSNWKTFPVKIINENEYNVTFVSTTTEFGCFSITGKVNENQNSGDVIIIDMGGNVVDDLSSEDILNGSGGNGIVSKDGDVFNSILRSMNELFIKGNPLNS